LAAIQALNSTGIDPAGVKRVFRFVKRREWRGAEPQASGEAEGLYSRSLHLGNKFLAMESGAEVLRTLGRVSGNGPKPPADV
jgi:hypothetical protein